MDSWIKKIIDDRVASTSAKIKNDPIAGFVGQLGSEIWNLPRDIKNKIGAIPEYISKKLDFSTPISPIPTGVGTKVMPTNTPKPTVTPSPTITPTPTVTPTAAPRKSFFSFLNRPSPTPTATPTPAPKPEYVPYFDFNKYANIPKEYQASLAQPSGQLGREIMTNFDKTGEATPAALTALSENMSQPYSTEGYNFNTPGDKRVTPGFEGSGDYGPWQINSKTMEDYIRRFPRQTAAIGIRSVADLKDNIKSTKLARMIWNTQGAGAWKGWVNKGITWK